MSSKKLFFLRCFEKSKTANLLRHEILQILLLVYVQMSKNVSSPSELTHTINNHLTVIIGWTNMLERRLHLAEDYDAEALQIISQIRNAAFAVASETKLKGAIEAGNPSKTYVEIDKGVEDKHELFQEFT